MKTSSLGNTISIVKGNERTDIKIRLNDECHNGHEDFSITADIREKGSRGQWVDAGGGCCHEHILSLRPDLKPFVDLHLCTWQGIPMHCATNAFYWLAGYLSLPYVEYHGGSGSIAKSKDECLRIFLEHVRATDDEVPTLLECRSQEELKIAIEDLGILDRWKQEADAAIKQLEEWSGKEFESKATRGFWEPVTISARQLAKERRESGYYTPEAIAARDAEKAAAAKAKKRQSIINDHQRQIKKIERDLDIDLFILDNFGTVNCIYYDHSNELSFNWSSTNKLITKNEFDAIAEVFKIFRTDLFPEGVKLVWNERPKH